MVGDLGVGADGGGGLLVLVAAPVHPTRLEAPVLTAA